MNRTCYYHPQHVLHNFCINTECSLPLCPKCINIHLNQSTSQKHHIQSLEETVSMVREQLDTAIQAISHNLEAIKKGEFTPQNCMKQYADIVQKYRSEALSRINEHYNYIKRQLFEQLKSKYACHFGSLATPLEQNMLELQRTRKSLEQKPIECMIKFISQQTITHVEKLLQRIDENKQAFKFQLPRLQGVEGDKLKIVPGGIVGIVSKSLGENSRIEEKSMTNFRSTGGPGRYISELDDLDRINRLQAELYSLRSECY